MEPEIFKVFNATTAWALFTHFSNSHVDGKCNKWHTNKSKGGTRPPFFRLALMLMCSWEPWHAMKSGRNNKFSIRSIRWNPFDKPVHCSYSELLFWKWKSLASAMEAISGAQAKMQQLEMQSISDTWAEPNSCYWSRLNVHSILAVSFTKWSLFRCVPSNGMKEQKCTNTYAFIWMWVSTNFTSFFSCSFYHCDFCSLARAHTVSLSAFQVSVSFLHFLRRRLVSVFFSLQLADENNKGNTNKKNASCTWYSQIASRMEQNAKKTKEKESERVSEQKKNESKVVLNSETYAFAFKPF